MVLYKDYTGIRGEDISDLYSTRTVLVGFRQAPYRYRTNTITHAFIHASFSQYKDYVALTLCRYLRYGTLSKEVTRCTRTSTVLFFFLCARCNGRTTFFLEGDFFIKI